MLAHRLVTHIQSVVLICFRSRKSGLGKRDSSCLKCRVLCQSSFGPIPNKGHRSYVGTSIVFHFRMYSTQVSRWKWQTLSFHWWKSDEENNHRKRRKNPWRSKPNRCNTAGRPWGNPWESPKGWCFKNRHVFRRGFHIPYSSGFDITPIQTSNEVDTLNCLFSNVHLFTYERCNDLSSDEKMYTYIQLLQTWHVFGWMTQAPAMQ